MCNEAARLRSLGEISAEFNQLKIPLRFPEGLPNLGEAPSIRITDATVIVRAAAGEGEAESPTPGPSRRREGGCAELVVRRWSWPGAAGKPVYNFRSEGRSFANSATGGRCLIPLDAFFEFTDPGTAADAAAGTLPLSGQSAPREGARRGKARKDKWRFTAADGRGFAVAGLWRAGVVPGTEPRATEAFTMLTAAPGPDVAPYHHRQIVVMPRERWADWLGGVVSAADLIAPPPAGTFVATRVR